MSEIDDSEKSQLQLRADLQELKIEHRDLDHAIETLSADPAVDQVRLRRFHIKRLIEPNGSDADFIFGDLAVKMIPIQLWVHVNQVRPRLLWQEKT